MRAGAPESQEALGTKYKFWYRDDTYGMCLFKEGRPNTGENWAERIAAELARLIDLPHADYELAEYDNRRGVISKTLVAGGARIVHGNELLPSYTGWSSVSGGPLFRNTEYTLGRVMAYLWGGRELISAPYSWPKPECCESALDFFIGYLLFDAWIANQDRHDQNWAVIRANDGSLYLSPSFDHGSSMARNLSAEERFSRLSTNDKSWHISYFVSKAQSAFRVGGSKNSRRRVGTLDAFVKAASLNLRAAEAWRQKLHEVSEDEILAVIEQMPIDWMSDIEKAFTHELLRLNRERLLAVKLA